MRSALLLAVAVLALGSVGMGPRTDFADPDFVYLGPGLHLFRNSERVEFLQHRLAAGEDAETRLLLAAEQVRAGRPREALLSLQALGADPRAVRARALASLRLGEQENCLDAHCAASCVFPLQGAGLHGTAPEGSRAAMALYEQTLERAPGDPGARWALNIAAMTLGVEPPARWRIDLPDRVSEAAWPAFPDRAAEQGVDVLGNAGGCVFEDLDGDGWADLVVSGWFERERLRYFRNERGRFVERPMLPVAGGLNMTHADYDNDGDEDLLVLRGGWWGPDGRLPASLLRNRGDGTFEDVTRDAGLASRRPTQVGAWADYDGDGWLDLFVGAESSEVGGFPCELYHNRGDGTFAEVAAQVGLDYLGFVKGATWGDVDEDGRPDLYLSCYEGRNVLFRNEGARFRDITATAGVGEPILSFPTWFWDYDQDGHLDLFVGGYTNGSLRHVLGHEAGLTCRLYRGHGDGTFTDVTAEAGLLRPVAVMGSNFGDLDGDGYPDLVLGTGEPDFEALTPNLVFRNDRGRRFQNVTAASRMGNLQKGHAVAMADQDHDGDRDVYHVLGGAYEGDVYRNALYENPFGGGSWLGLKLVGTRSNRSALGARLRVRTDRGVVHGHVGAGGSFGSSSFTQLLGLGDATRVESVTVRWPSGKVQEVPGLAPGRTYRVVEEP